MVKRDEKSLSFSLSHTRHGTRKYLILQICMYTSICVQIGKEYAMQARNNKSDPPSSLSVLLNMSVIAANNAGNDQSEVLLSFKAGKMEHKLKDGTEGGGKKPTFMIKPDLMPGMTLLHCCY